MSAKDSITTQTCELSQGEFNDFLALYPIPFEYHVILPKSNQTIFDAPPGYVGLYTYSFSIENLRLPLTEFFCKVLEYFQVHISRLNPFGCANLTTFVVMCKAYGCEPSLNLFQGFFNLCRAGKWLTFAKRSEKHILNLLPKVITHIEDKLPPNIEENHMFQRLSRYPTSVRVFPDPIIFLAGLKPSWEHGQQRPAIMKWLSGTSSILEMMMTLFFLPKELSPRFGIGSPSTLVNKKPPKDVEEPEVQPAKVTADSGESPKAGVFVVHLGSVAARIRKCKTRGGSLRPPMKRKLASGLSTSRVVRAKTSASKDDAPFFPYLMMMRAVVDNAVNRRAHEFLQVIEKMSGEANVIKAREKSCEEECEGLRVKCEAAMAEFDQNPVVLALQEKISSLTADVNSLEADKARLEVVEASLRREVEELNQDRRDAVLKVVPYAAMKLVHSDELGRIVGKLVSYAIIYGRYRAYKQKGHTQASNDFATATFPWLDEFVADATAPIETLLSKKPPMLQKHAPSRTQMHVPSS
ncbi:hypothetical protein Tco_0318621 [Tanacetum coccineum]